MREGVDGLLRDKTRPPGKAALAADLVKRIVDLTLAEPPGETTHWTGRAMAQAAGAAVGGRQDNAGARRVLLQAVAISDDPIKAAPIFRRDFNHDPCSHTQSMRQITAFGNPS